VDEPSGCDVLGQVRLIHEAKARLDIEPEFRPLRDAGFEHES